MRRAFKVKKLSKKSHRLIGGGLDIDVATLRKPSNQHSGEYRVDISIAKNGKLLVSKNVEGTWEDVLAFGLEYWRW